MDLVFSNRQFAVFDNVLSDKEFRFVWNFIQNEEYHSVHQFGWRKVFRLGDGDPLEGAVVFSQLAPGINPERVKIYPTNTAIDILIKFMMENSSRYEEWVGVRSKDWEVFSAKPYLFPQGSGLSWHQDHKGQTGSFTFYAHPSWNVQWGGELLVADESVKDLRAPELEFYGDNPSRGSAPHLDNAFENEKLFEVGIGQYILPKPNRLVVIAGGNLHRINSAEGAGDRVRSSISGFFLSKTAKRGGPGGPPKEGAGAGR